MYRYLLEAADAVSFTHEVGIFVRSKVSFYIFSRAKVIFRPMAQI